MPLNIEIKARCADLDRVRSVLRQRSADYRGLDRQTDTYFNVGDGRLKLRQGNIENALIHYRRADDVEPKPSDFILYRSDNAERLKELLIRALGIMVVVEKQREIYFLGSVKVHLDRVAGLGTFVEIEATDGGGAPDPVRQRQQCDELAAAFGISPGDLLALSYSDMVLEEEGA